MSNSAANRLASASIRARVLACLTSSWRNCASEHSRMPPSGTRCAGIRKCPSSWAIENRRRLDELALATRIAPLDLTMSVTSAASNPLVSSSLIDTISSRNAVRSRRHSSLSLVSPGSSQRSCRRARRRGESSATAKRLMSPRHLPFWEAARVARGWAEAIRVSRSGKLS